MTLSKADNINLIMAFVTVFLDNMNHSLIIPILPFIVEELQASDMESGVLYSGYSLFQLLSLTIAGAYSDIYGRRIFLLLSLIGSCVGSILQYYSRSIIPLIIWRSITGLFAGSNILVQAVIADITPLEDRNKYYSRLEALTSAAFILGPALAGILAGISIWFPLMFAGIISGVALVLAVFLLKESSRDIIAINELKKKRKTATEEEKRTIQEDINKRMKDIKKSRKQESPKLTSVMCLCFIFEFCNRWAVNAFDSKFGIYVNGKFELSSSLYSGLICAQSCFTCVMQAFAYPFIVGKLKVPVPYLAVVGTVIQTISYFFMSYSNTLWGAMIASTGLWLGFTFAVPSAVSIISTTNAPEVQGKVLSWNNICSQLSLIASPIVLSAIYSKNRDAMYYFSMVFSFIAFIVMAYISTWPNAKTLGLQKQEEEKKKPDIEMAEMETKKPESNDATSPIKTEEQVTEQSVSSDKVVSAVVSPGN